MDVTAAKGIISKMGTRRLALSSSVGPTPPELGKVGFARYERIASVVAAE
jgi:hypothetical protein